MSSIVSQGVLLGEKALSKVLPPVTTDLLVGGSSPSGRARFLRG